MNLIYPVTLQLAEQNMQTVAIKGIEKRTCLIKL